jgi:hypothetical protein
LITEKIGLVKEELMPKIKQWMLSQALPHHKNLIGAHENAARVVENVTQDENINMRNLVLNIVKKVSANSKISWTQYAPANMKKFHYP